MEFEQGLVTALKLRTKRFRLLFSDIGVIFDPRLFSSYYPKNLALGSDLIKGVPETLKSLSGRIHITLVTNDLKDVQRPRLENSSIYNLVEKVFISEEIGAAKPDRAFFELVFRKLDNPNKNEVLIIGDRLTSDMLGGIQFGIDTCWYNPGEKATSLAVTFQIQSLPELIPLLG